MVEPARQRIVVGVDGSEAALQAVRWAATQARSRPASLQLLFVRADGGPDPELVRDEAFRAVGADVEVTWSVKEGDPTATLVAVAESADMLVVARGDGVSLRVAAEARCPVVLVPSSRRSIERD